MSGERTFRLDKLVRDGIVDSNLQQGITMEYTVLTGSELLSAILDKISEEVGEAKAAKSNGELASELQDILDLVQAAIKAAGITVAEHEANTYDEGHFIHTLTAPVGNKWGEYFASQPDRFPEIT